MEIHRRTIGGRRAGHQLPGGRPRRPGDPVARWRVRCQRRNRLGSEQYRRSLPGIGCLAPDMLGFGQSAKVIDFNDGRGMRIRHIARFCDELGVDSAHFVGNSMGAINLLVDATSDSPVLPMRSLVAICGGGDIQRNQHMQALYDYDATPAGHAPDRRGAVPRSGLSGGRRLRAASLRIQHRARRVGDAGRGPFPPARSPPRPRRRARGPTSVSRFRRWWSRAAATSCCRPGWAKEIADQIPARPVGRDRRGRPLPADRAAVDVNASAAGLSGRCRFDQLIHRHTQSRHQAGIHLLLSFGRFAVNCRLTSGCRAVGAVKEFCEVHPMYRGTEPAGRRRAGAIGMRQQQQHLDIRVRIVIGPVNCGGKKKLLASGSTAQTNAIEQFVYAYIRACPGFTLDYNANGSGAGVQQFVNNETDLGGSDKPLDPGEGRTRPGAAAVRFTRLGPAGGLRPDRGHLQPRRCEHAEPGRAHRREDLQRRHHHVERSGHQGAQRQRQPAGDADQRGVPQRQIRHDLQLPEVSRRRVRRRLG